MTTKGVTVPPPGSDMAVKIGCACPRADNAYGAGVHATSSRRLFWIQPGCRLHAPKGDSALEERALAEWPS